MIAVALTSVGCTDDERPAEQSSSSVHIADDVFGWADADMTVSNETVVVRTSAPTDAAVRAMTRIATRFMRVDETGVEHGAEVEEAPPLDSNGKPLYTPNYVSTPSPMPDGIHMYVDCKGVIDPRMRTRFLRIMTEELEPLDGDVFVAVAP